MTTRILMREAFALLAVCAALPARADYAIGFYAHELGTQFPHAFFTVKGRPDGGGAEVDTNYGFTAKSVTPAILWGPVDGMVETAKAGYVASSHRLFSLRVADATYARLMAVVARWRDAGPKSYDLGTRNCVHFIGEAARAAGLAVDFPKALMKRPRSYLQHIHDMNPDQGLQP